MPPPKPRHPPPARIARFLRQALRLLSSESTYPLAVNADEPVHQIEAISAGRGWADVAAEYGYSDQAHLVNEFRALSGLAPREFFRNETPMGAGLVG